MPGTKVVLFALVISALCGCRTPSAQSRILKSSVEPSIAPRHKSFIYPYSVVPGGVETSQDIAQAMSSDAATAVHYRDVNVAALRPVRLAANTLAYVSYRKNGRIYWTRRQVHLASGESVLSNGRDCVRGRCGNRVSLTPRNPVIEEANREPAPEVFSTPAVNGMSIDEIAPPLVMTMFNLPSLAVPQAAPEYPGSTAPPVSPAAIVPKAGPETWPPGPAPAAMPAAGAMPAILPPALPSPAGFVTPSPIVAGANVPAVPILSALFVVPSYLQPSPPPSTGLPAASPLAVVFSPLPPPNTGIPSSTVATSWTTTGNTPAPPALPPPAEHTPPGSSPPPQNVFPCCTPASQPHPPANTTPEPGSLLLLAAGLLGLWIVRRQAAARLLR